MVNYTKRSQELARALAAKAARNLRRAGRSVEQDPATGRYVIDAGKDADSYISDQVEELRAEGHPDFSREVIDRIWISLDGHPGFRRLSASKQRRGFGLLVDQIRASPTPATPQAIESWKPEIYSELGLKVIRPHSPS